jgi:predicted amidohydrolase YtcJ
VVLDRDILTCTDEEVRTIGVLQTYVDGELVFEKA